MFNKLRIKFTLITLLLLSIVLLMIFTGVYFLMKDGMQRQSEVLMSTIAREERIIPPMDISKASPGNIKAPPVLANYFFVKTDTEGKIFEVSPVPFITSEDATSLAGETLKRSHSSGLLNFNNYKFSYLKESKNYGYILVFLDRSSDSVVLSRLILISFIIGIVSLLFVFLISLYLSNKAIIPIRNSWEKQTAFVADASHELRTPLTVMNSNLEIVLENSCETVESQSKWLGNIESELARMTKLVEDLLFLARADTDENDMPVLPMNLSETLKLSVSSFEPFAGKKGILLYSNVQPDIFMEGNEWRIKQLTAILLDNAIKHTPQGGKIQLTAKTGENCAEIIVSDTGEGIPKEHLERIFERFYRVDKSRARSLGGSGLGLSIAKCIVKEHMGNINVSSTVGKGTNFVISFPIKSSLSKK